MRLTYKFNINSNKSILDLCLVSKNLYNQALFEIKQSLKDNKPLFYYDLDKLMKTKTNLEGDINYRLLKAKVSQQILIQLDKDIKSYFSAIKDYSKNPSKYNGKPNLPNYKKEYNFLIYTNQSSTIKNGYIFLSKNLKISIPQWNKYKYLIKDFKQLRIIPKNEYLTVEIIYDIKEVINPDLIENKYSSIDLGINNLVTLISEDKPILFNGKQIKSINQYFNKKLNKLQSIKDLQKIKGKTTATIIFHKIIQKLIIINEIFHTFTKIKLFIYEKD